MRVCLINPLCQPSLWENEIISHEPPLGLCYIASILEKNGHKIKILERRRIIDRRRRTEKNLRRLDEETYKQIRAFSPEYVGITATTPLIMDAYRVAKITKRVNSNIKVMIGGPHPTAEPIRTLQDCKEIDVVCIGEGEFTFLEFVESHSFDKIQGIAYRDNGKVVFTEQRDFCQNIDSLSFPARHLLDRNHYFSPQSTTIRGNYLIGTTILAARGCPYKCTFCQSSHLSKIAKGEYVRFHSPEFVIEEIKSLIKNYRIQGILFAEDTFSLKKSNVYNICELLAKEGISKKIKWAVNLRVDIVDTELLKLMKRAGCVQVIYGCESGSQNTLDRLQKKTTVEQNYRAVELTKRAGLCCEVNVMVGLPGETEVDFLKTIEFLKRAKPDRIVKGKLYPLPGTSIYEELKEKNIIEEPLNWNDLWDLYVHTDFTFASVARERFTKLYLRMDREAVYRRNYWNEIRNLAKKHPLKVATKSITMLMHLGVLYLPKSIQKTIQAMIDRVKVRLGILFE
jgi:anaerobic magnesium-protoporphyrin IX monomethyl ester cyclase